jgi:hypothetical protein
MPFSKKKLVVSRPAIVTKRVLTPSSALKLSPPSVPVVTAAVCGRALSWRRQTLLSD